MTDEPSTYANPDTLPSGLSDDTREKLASIMESGMAQSGIRKRDSHVITPLVCEVIREMHEQGVSPTEIVNFFPVKSQSTLYYHINDKCSHNHRVRLTYSECGWMRVKAGNGEPSKVLAEEYGISQRVASRHILGDCSHEDGILPIDPGELRSNSYNGITMTTSVCKLCGDEFEHAKTRDRMACSRECSAKQATIKRLEKESTSD